MMTVEARLIFSAVIGIAAAIILIVRLRFHPFLALLCGAMAVGMLVGMPMNDVVKAIEKGAGDVLGSTGLVVALGLLLGAMLQLSDGAGALARSALRVCPPSAAPWMSMAVALVVGLPLFFETGVVLVLPIAAATAVTMEKTGRKVPNRLQLMLPALGGLSTLHALVPPHPGPLLAIEALHANLSRTILYGVAVGIPTAIVSGPIFAAWIGRRVVSQAPFIAPPEALTLAPGPVRSVACILLPVLLIAGGQIGAEMPAGSASYVAVLHAVSNPISALIIANLAAMPLLFGKQMGESRIQGAVWSEAMKPAGSIILAIGAGGALKQVLVTAGLGDLLAHLSAHGSIPAVPMAWFIAVCIRLATGSATVATITAAGIMPAVVAATGASPEWTVLAIGAGSVFFSHVNDPGFWLVRGYLGTSVSDTFRTWSVVETLISVSGLAFVLIGSAIL